jgi:hypothetical protein
MRKDGEMAHDPRDRHIEAILDEFLHNLSTEQSHDYVARGRCFSALGVEQLNKDWIMAIRSWLARKERTIERVMDDLASELYLRGLQPPYNAIKHELDNWSARTKYADRKEARISLARKIDKFVRHNKSRTIN